ncbi:MAG: hypothetical protein LBK94_13410 [Prevotellaceae bacterium]|jgi:hypothetical protein|nr:hypothetical protein [Prevotellaceae bacterium]
MDLCTNSGGNTGIGACDLSSSKLTPIGIIFVPKNAQIPLETADILSFLDVKFKEDSRQARWYPMLGIQAIADSSEEAQMATLALGYSEKIRNGNAIYQFDIPFSLCKAKTVIPFDGWNGGIYFILSSGLIMGRKDRKGQNLFPIIPLQTNITNAQLLSLGTTDARVVSIQINLNDKLRLVDIVDFLTIEDFDTTDINGIIDVDLLPGAVATGYVDIKVQTKCDAVNLFDTYQVELAAKALWVLINKSTGAVATIATVEAQAGTKAFRVSADAGTYLLSLVSVSALETAHIAGYESNQITVEIQ